MTKRRPTILPAVCPLCGDPAIIRLPADWETYVENGARVPIIGCGNPWHYADFDKVPAPATVRVRG